MEQYGLIGFPLGHSFSRKYFNEKFAHEGIEAEYLNFPIERIELFPEIIAAHPELKGLNVTIPYKESVMAYLDEVSEEAQRVGAVNVIRVEQRDGKPYLIGYNSDVIGFTNSILPFLKEGIHTKALILGTGGAAKSVFYSLQKLGLEVAYVSRQPREGVLTYAQLTPALLQEYPVVVNCTPCGMYPRVEESPELPYSGMTEKNLLFDLVYNPELTMFMQQGAEQGAAIKNGLEMLILQANAGWEFWQGSR